MLTVIAAAVYLDIFRFFFVELTKAILQDKMDAKTYLWLIFLMQHLLIQLSGYFPRYYVISQIATFLITSFYLNPIKLYIYTISMSLLFPLYFMDLYEILIKYFFC